MSVAVLHQLRNYFCVWSHIGHTPSWAPFHGKHPKVNVPQWRADPWADPGQWPVIILVLPARAHHPARASSEPGAASITVPEPVQSQGKLIKLAWYKVMQSIIGEQTETRLMNLKQISFLYHVGSVLYTKNWKFCSYRYHREGHEKVMSQQGRALLPLKTTHSPLLHKHTSLTPKQTLRDRY